ncbi:MULTISPECIES: peptide ABC transporter substrate-binding protein [Paenibacillus]|uniref:Peptide ABC transporter substrate-binding protein n=1 Tax=Paenibacillus campinasensis TaxID=66347 RepID=A0A268F4R8_9BACL|nr:MULTISPECIES: peptide ABC transporter substrate-binding protein [Paenibacillus]MUG64640.1 peptide ABC transporter substrate-binding protein [Paenibacillus campinasensis]PAD80360.1 peptide-binding protein [Paenibacillus campinasensis]PAK55343.1 peptide-binding protein [Paenibacillus sp. 7541]
MRKHKKLLLLMTLILAFSSVLAACGANNNNESANNGDAGKPKDQVFRMNLASEPPTLDPGLSQDNTSNTIINAVFEGLVRKGEDGTELPGVAESWDISEDGLKYVFHLRQDAKWSNGDPVTANDFEYAWKRVLDPNLTPASPYTYQLYYIKNAEAYNGGDIKDASEVGVKATDDYTLEVTLENPTPYFLSLMSFQTYFPVHSSIEGNPQWATKPDTLIGNGPFKVSQMVKGQKIELVKNDQYWDTESIKLEKVEMSIVNSAATELASYRNNELDYAGHPTGNIPTDQLNAVKNELGDQLEIKGIATTYYYVFNTTEEPFNNVNIRKAFSMAIDRNAIVEKITQGGQLPAFGFVPPGIKGENDEYRNEVSDAYFEDNLEEAKKLLEQGMSEEGYTTLPEVTIIHNSDDNHKRIALAIADMWKNNLGANVKVQNQEWGVFLKNRDDLNYQVARSGWGADYNDPMSFIDMWVSNSGNNDAGFNNEEYDQLVRGAYTTNDNAERMELMAQAEKILVEENQVIMPIYYYSSVSLIKPWVKNLHIDYKGDIDFTRAYIE